MTPARSCGGQCPHHGQHGFTLVELLVALAVMAMLSLMAWRGVDAMSRTQESTRRISSEVQVLQAGLIQWGLDLDALAPSAPITALDFDGQVLRITRQVLVDDPALTGIDTGTAAGGGGLRVVAWGVRVVDGQRQWLRWQSGLLRTRGEWELAWQQAAWWGQNPSAELRRSEVVMVPVDRWEVFYYRNNSWTSPLSSASEGGQAPAAQQPLPDGVRLVLFLSDGQSISGSLRRDWVRPTLGPGGA
jgi:general secretion pathway protein J